VLLYTDGLVERRRQPLDDGISRAADLVSAARRADPEDLADQLMSGLAPTDGYEDDVALLLFRQPGPLVLDFAADTGNVATTRNAMRDWLGRCGLDEDQTLNMLIAVGEAVANAIEHGHRDAPGGTIRLRATALVDGLTFVVTDSGSWKEPRPEANPYRGRGMGLMRALMHEVTVDSATTGTTVQLHARIS
jgi:anti-sigma regulatory factor (Ser/Thr protein kinase)